jgi:acyl carrier protein
MENNLDIPSQLLDFLDRQIGKSWWLKVEISSATRLYEDLKIDGDDAVDFFQEFEKEFRVDISGLDLSKYFNGEGFDPIGLHKLVEMIIGRKNSTPLGKRKSINLGHLIEAIKKGKLDESIING